MFKRSGATQPPKRIARVYAGGHSSFAIDEAGVPWFWGANNWSQGGLKNPNKTDVMILTPTPVLGLPPIAQIASSDHHTLFLTRDGDVYSTGRGDDGRLGHGDLETCETPKRIEMLSALPHSDKVVSVSCGEAHSLVVTQLGRIYSFGYGDLLQLGNGVEEDVVAPLAVTCAPFDTEGGFGRRVLHASGGSQHSLFLTVKRSSKSAFADDAPVAAAAAPAPVAQAKKITSLAELRQTGGWECDSCLLYNKDSLTVCPACEAPKPGTALSNKPTFNFGGASSAAPAEGAAAAPAFSFGAAPAAAAATSADAAAAPAAAVSVPTGGFSFGSGAISFGSAPITFGAQPAKE